MRVLSNGAGSTCLTDHVHVMEIPFIEVYFVGLD